MRSVREAPPHEGGPSKPARFHSRTSIYPLRLSMVATRHLTPEAARACPASRALGPRPSQVFLRAPAATWSRQSLCGRRRPAAPGGAQPAPAPAMPVTAATRTRWLAVGASSSSQLDRENRRRFILCKAGHLLLPCSAKSASAAVAGTSASVRSSANAEPAACLKGSGGHAGGGDGLVVGEAGEGRDELPRHDDGVGRCPFEPFDGQNGEARSEESFGQLDAFDALALADFKLGPPFARWQSFCKGWSSGRTLLPRNHRQDELVASIIVNGAPCLL